MKIPKLILICSLISPLSFAEINPWVQLKKMQQEIDGMHQNLNGIQQNLNAVQQNINGMQQDITTIKQQIINMTPGGGTPAVSIDHYTKTGSCTALTTQPTDACASSLFCYDTDDFVDTGSNSLVGYTFRAVKSTPDAANKDGGIVLCDNTANSLTVSVLSQCTHIGGNVRNGSNTVEFVIPPGVSDGRVVALTMNSIGVLSGSSALTGISVCKTTGVPDLTSAP